MTTPDKKKDYTTLRTTHTMRRRFKSFCTDIERDGDMVGVLDVILDDALDDKNRDRTVKLVKTKYKQRG